MENRSRQPQWSDQALSEVNIKTVLQVAREERTTHFQFLPTFLGPICVNESFYASYLDQSHTIANLPSSVTVACEYVGSGVCAFIY
jgi:hypothetical protein